MCKLSLNQNLTCKYNPSDDYFYVLLNGTWKKAIKAFAQSIAFYVNGVFAQTMDNGIVRGHSYYDQLLPFSLANSKISATMTQSTINQEFTIITHEPIDVTNYSVAKFTVNGTIYTVDLSSLSGNYYIGMSYYYQSSSNNQLICCVSANKTDFAYTANAVSIDRGPTIASVEITEIMIE